MHRVLIVEDHDDIRRLVRLTLEFEGFEVIEASDGPTGLAAARASIPDLMVLDVMMPGGIDGHEVCRQIRADVKTQGIPIVMLTARGSSADRSAGFAAGADAYLLKPFSPLQLLQKVRACIEEGRLPPEESAASHGRLQA